jgi:glycosyltransferase involved in cell wall biosynthesis
MSVERLTIVSPVLNEARHIEAVVRAMRFQTRPPDEWIVVDDGSEDGTRDLLRRAEEAVPFMRVVEAPEAPLAAGADRLHHAAEARAFNYGLSLASSFTHVGKLDGDIELPPDYYERLLGRFRDDTSLGLAGGVLVEPTSRGWELRGDSDLQHVRGALKLYTRQCFETIGGVREMLGWDGVDEVLARMHGYGTRSFPDAVARHHRPVGTAQGRLRGSYRLGRSMFIEGYPFVWVTARSLKVGKSRPLAVTGLAYLAGYVGAAVHGVSRFEASGYREHLHSELRGRAAQKLRSALAH